MIPDPEPVRPPLEILTTIGQGALTVAIVAGVIAVAIVASWPLSARVEWLAIGRSRPAVFVLVGALVVGVIAAVIAAILLV